MVDEKKKEVSEGKKTDIDVLGLRISRETLLIFGATLLFFISFYAYFFFIDRPQLAFVYSEGRLEKVANLSLADGELYSYEYLMNGSKVGEAAYAVKARGGCTAIYGSSTLTKAPPVCLDSRGNDLLDKEGKNLSLGNGAIELFSPWMLAVNEGWAWKAKLRGELPNIGPVGESETILREAGEEKIYGRDSYKILGEVRAGNESLKFELWVDKEKRVLLRQAAGDAEIRITGAPFPLVIGNRTVAPLGSLNISDEIQQPSLYG